MWHERLAKKSRRKLHLLIMTVLVLNRGAMAHWWAIWHFALGHKAIWKIGYLVRKSIFVQKLAHPDAITFLFLLIILRSLKKWQKNCKLPRNDLFIFEDRVKHGKKLRTPTRWLFVLFFGDRLKIGKKSRNPTQWPFFGERSKVRKKLRERAMENFLNKNGPWLQKDWEPLVYDYMKALPSSIKEINFHSDTCSGKQRSWNFSSMCLHAIQKVPLVNINHKYFESGPSQMEVNSVHLTKERAKKFLDMNIPSEWYTAVRLSKRTQLKHEVIEVNTSDALDFKEVL